MTTKQSARPHQESANRDCFVVLHTLHHLSALLAMTQSGLFQQSHFAKKKGDAAICGSPWNLCLISLQPEEQNIRLDIRLVLEQNRGAKSLRSVQSKVRHPDRPPEVTIETCRTSGAQLEIH